MEVMDSPLIECFCSYKNIEGLKVKKKELVSSRALHMGTTSYGIISPHLPLEPVNRKTRKSSLRSEDTPFIRAEQFILIFYSLLCIFL
jgi:hypothetical protein